MKPNLYVMCGKPGAGKTKFAKASAAENDLRYISVDAFYNAVFGADNIRTHKFEIWQMLYAAVHIAACDEQNVILDINAPTVSMREELIRTFRPYFKSCNLIYIDAADSRCRKNNTKRTRRIPDSDLEKLFEQFEAPKPHEVGWGEHQWVHIFHYVNLENKIYSAGEIK